MVTVINVIIINQLLVTVINVINLREPNVIVKLINTYILVIQRWTKFLPRNHELLQQILKTLAEASVPEPESGAAEPSSRRMSSAVINVTIINQLLVTVINVINLREPNVIVK